MIIAVLFMVQNVIYFITQIRINIVNLVFIIKIVISITVKFIIDNLLESFPF